ncbi:MAG: MBL fold metallo-hydrolase [Erysipelotrichaceae bacterium]|nr:MBL fold metallo-hydrolase [Erysipelotrichaceae bacterium]
MKKKYTVILTIIFMILAGAFELFQGTVAITPSEDLKVHFLDVGQGDSIFIELPTNETILIDASIKDASNKIINYLREENVSKIDYVFATHPHSDHIGGMSAVIKTFDIGQIYMPKAVTTTKTYENLLLTIKDKNLKIKAAKAGNTIIDTDDLKLVVLAPNQDSYESLNNYSIVLKLTYKEKSFLFMGDAETLSEKEITGDVQADVLKVGHHGSRTSTSQAFLNKVNPSYAVISVGLNNDYKHPHQEVIDRLEKKNIKIYRTDQNGDIIFTTDGYNIDVKVEK